MTGTVLSGEVQVNQVITTCFVCVIDFPCSFSIKFDTIPPKAPKKFL